jgi:predicted nuclease with RNAse H fold
MHRGRTRGKHKLAFVAFDSAKEKHAVAIADDGRDGEVRYLGEIDNSPDAVRKLVAKLSIVALDAPAHLCEIDKATVASRSCPPAR